MAALWRRLFGLATRALKIAHTIHPRSLMDRAAAAAPLWGWMVVALLVLVLLALGLYAWRRWR